MSGSASSLIRETIACWSSAGGSSAGMSTPSTRTRAESPARADYTGLVIAQNSRGQNVLYATDFHNNKIDMFDGGDQANAMQHALQAFMALEGEIYAAWTPPAMERPDRDLVSAVRTGGLY